MTIFFKFKQCRPLKRRAAKVCLLIIAVLLPLIFVRLLHTSPYGSGMAVSNPWLATKPFESEISSDQIVDARGQNQESELVPSIRTVPFDRFADIPQYLWQTSPKKSVTKQQAEAMETWGVHNPDLERILQDDEDMAGFILKFYGPKMQELYHSFPFGVMRSDFWRYAVVYAKGGIYADTDVKCLKPLRDWFPPAGPKVKAGRLNPATIPAAGILHYTDLRWSDCSIVIGVEGHEGLCQWVFASVPGHPILLRAMRRSLELTTEAAKKNYSGGKEVDFVLAATGPRVWSDAVAEEIGIPTGLGAQAIQEQVWGDQKTYKRARELGLCLMSMSFVGGKGAIPENMEHQYASQFYDRDYHSWIANVTEHLNQTQGSTD